MSALYLEVSPQINPARLISEISIALQDQRDVYVICALQHAKKIEQILKYPYEAELQLGPLFDQSAPQESWMLAHTSLLGDEKFLKHLLFKADEDHNQYHMDPTQELNQRVDELTRTLNALLALLKRTLWLWYAKEVTIHATQEKNRMIFYCEHKVFDSYRRSQNIPF